MKPHDCIGWTLDDARAAYQSHFPSVPVRVLETAPPLRHNAKPSTNAETFGAWRVLRCAWSEDGADRTLEVVVARERVLQVLAGEFVEN